MRRTYKPRMDVLLALATLAVVAPVAAESSEPEKPRGREPDMFTRTSGQDRRARVQAIHDRTGWVYAKCRKLVDTMKDSEIEALVREHEEAQRAGGA